MPSNCSPARAAMLPTSAKFPTSARKVPASRCARRRSDAARTASGSRSIPVTRAPAASSASACPPPPRVPSRTDGSPASSPDTSVASTGTWYALAQSVAWSDGDRILAHPGAWRQARLNEWHAWSLARVTSGRRLRVAPAGFPIRRARRVTGVRQLLAVLLHLRVNRRCVLRNGGEQLPRGLGIDRTALLQIDLRGDKGILRRLGEIALLGGLVLTHRLIADLQARDADEEFGRRRRGHAVSEAEDLYCMLEILNGAGMRRVVRGLERLVAHREQELRDG